MRHFFSHGVTSYAYWNLALLSGGVSRWGWAQNSLVVVDPETWDRPRVGPPPPPLLDEVQAATAEHEEVDLVPLAARVAELEVRPCPKG